MQAAFLEVYLYSQGERRKQRCAEYKWNPNLLQILNQLQLITDAEQTADPASGDAQPGFGLALAPLQGSEANPEQSNHFIRVQGVVMRSFWHHVLLFQGAASNTLIAGFGAGVETPLLLLLSVFRAGSSWNTE